MPNRVSFVRTALLELNMTIQSIYIEYDFHITESESYGHI